MATKVREQQVHSERVKKLRDSLIFDIKPKISCERLKFLMESYRETEGEPTIMRRAKAFDRILKGMTIFIDDNPIVGTLTKYRGGIQPYPEWSCRWMTKGEESLASLGKAETSKEDGELLRAAVDYWADKCILSKAKDAWAQKYPGISRDDIGKVGVWVDELPTPWSTTVDYAKVINKGLKAVVEEAEQELRKLYPGSLQDWRKRQFLDSAIIACNAVIGFAQRYAFLARDMVQKEADPQRRAELERIANTCEKVPANPATTFYEAIQSFWFIHVASLIEAVGPGYSPGRFCCYMYPFYRNDKEGGRITEEEATELLELLIIKFTEVGMYTPRRYFESLMGTTAQNIGLGGLTPDGEDATNEMDFLLLEAQRRVQLIQPTLSVLYHDKLSVEFLHKAIELVKTGIGMPAFFNNDLAVRRCLVQQGATLEEARNVSFQGCLYTVVPHATDIFWFGQINMPKLLELALNNGKDPLTGIQVGPQTGNIEGFTSYDELHDAVRKQLRYFLPLLIEWELMGHNADAELAPVPFVSALLDNCIKNGSDVTESGAKYSGFGVGTCGMIDLANSLAAIKKLVSEEKLVTMRELMDALKANFEGYGELHRKLLNAPKYGNDGDYVDSIAKEWYNIFAEEHHGFKDRLGRPTFPYAMSVTVHNAFGLRTGALPSGRKAKLPLTDAAVSATPGTDRNGPTALIRSATKVIDVGKYATSHLNMKFHPSSLAAKEGAGSLLALIKTYMDLGGYHVQFNVVSGDTLRDAQVHPENYRDLIVRVAGFSAFFVNLDRTVQDELIRRTEIRFDQR